MRKKFENFTTSLILIGFFVFVGGVIFSLVRLSTQYHIPFEVQIALIGLSLIFLGILAAKIFDEVKFYE